MTTRKQTVLFPHQTEGVEAISRFRGRALLADEMGLGKSLTSLSWLVEADSNFPAIAIVPASLKYNWQREADRHLNLRAEVLEGKTPNRPAPKAWRVLWVINYDILGGWLDWLMDLEANTLILDECVAVKSIKAKRTKYTRLLCKQIPHVLALSGTPLTNRPSELFSVLNMVRPDLFPSFWNYAARYCQMRQTPWGMDYSGAKNLPELHQRLSSSLMIRRLKRDVLTLPAKTRVVTPLPIDHEARYKKAVRDFLAWMREEYPHKAAKAARAERLVQVGYLKRLAAELKLAYVFDWVDNFLESTDEKLILFGIHKLILGSLAQRYARLSVLVDGSVPAKTRQDRVDQFTNDRDCRLFLGNITAAGTGWNGTAASTVAFAEIAWTPAEMSQCEDRVERIGQTQPCFAHWLVAHGTIEESLCGLLQKKQRILTQVLDGEEAEPDMQVLDQLVALLQEEEDR